MTWGAAFVIALLCVLASWRLLVRLSEDLHPGAINTVLVIAGAFTSTTVLSVTILALLRQAVA
jgi:hypothetical protein